MAFATPAPIPWLYNKLWRDQDEGGQAYKVTVYQGTLCSCGNRPGAPPTITCKACGGVGFLYPLAPLQVLALVSDVEQHTDLVAAGLMTYGDLVLSTQPGAIQLNNYDIVLVPWQVGIPAQDQVVQRSTTGSEDRAWYRLQQVSGAWTVNSSTGEVTSYTPGAPDPETGEIPGNADFTWSGHTITWLRNQPAAGSLYSLRYTADYEWVAFDPPSPRTAFGQDLGQRVVLRKRHIVLPNAPVPIIGG